MSSDLTSLLRLTKDEKLIVHSTNFCYHITPVQPLSFLTLPPSRGGVTVNLFIIVHSRKLNLVPDLVSLFNTEYVPTPVFSDDGFTVFYKYEERYVFTFLGS